MKKIIFLKEFESMKRGMTALVDDEMAYELSDKKIAIIAKNYDNKMMTTGISINLEK